MQKIFNDYSVFEKSGWESLVLKNRSYIKDNLTLACDLDLKINFDKQKINLVLETLNVKVKLI
jgi:hypothetical protein